MFVSNVQVLAAVYLMGLVAAAPLGPVNMLAIRRGMIGGWRHTLACGIGSVAGDLILFSLVLLGGRHLLSDLSNPTLRTVLAAIGVIVVLPLGLYFPVRAVKEPLRAYAGARKRWDEGTVPAHLAADVAAGTALTLFNPATMVVTLRQACVIPATPEVYTPSVETRSKENSKMSLPFSPQFLEDKNRLDAWRETAGRRPIPDGLWKAAVSHVKEYGLNRVSREFRLGYTKLKEKTLTLGGSLPEAKPALSSTPQFIELALPREIPTPAEPSPRLRLIFERADGDRLSVEGSQPDLVFMDGLIRSFYAR